MRKTLLATAILLPSLLFQGCSNITKEDTGTAAGGVFGVLIGSLFGDGAGKATAMAIGGLVGAMAGKSVGREMDEADRLKADRAAFAAANTETAERIRWYSDANPGVKGYAEPVAPAEIDDGDLCKQVRSVYVIEGEEKSVTNRFCFKNGQWVDG
jgi:surface antigen